MIISTADSIAGQRVVETKGPAIGSVVIVPPLQEISQSQGKIVGEYGDWTRMTWTFRRQAFDRMVQDATAIGANGIVAMRFDTSAMTQVGHEIVAYGTAVVLVPDSSAAPPPVG